ncbi:amino acid ABC transporter permease [Mesorhizobium sp. INR15]|uniref:amino acid ABC transporter permease n=1 Tax=Mesorhizobium sp. INR15 TaxID=2654248 RepID=UPI002156272B|nr:amino acid ABC transporter permease [Mesorhizobium sp. INR15]
MPLLLKGAVTTVTISVCAMSLALVLGLVAAIGRMSRRRSLRFISGFYVEVIRGTPLLVQLFIVYYGLPSYGIRLEPFMAGFLTLGIHYGAYLSEVYRAGILSVDRGQWEAAASIGMTRSSVLRVIILPQAIRVILPPIGNYFISMLKDSALTATITVSELLRAGQLRVAITFRAMDIYLMVAAIYLTLSYPLSILIRWLEKRSSRGFDAHE